MSLYSPKPGSSHAKRLVESRNMLPYQASILDVNRAVHYKKGKQLGQGYYIIEISSGKDTLYITAFNIECSQSLIMEIKQP
jgi:hypothetical protein